MVSPMVPPLLSSPGYSEVSDGSYHSSPQSPQHLQRKEMDGVVGEYLSPHQHYTLLTSGLNESPCTSGHPPCDGGGVGGGIAGGVCGLGLLQPQHQPSSCSVLPTNNKQQHLESCNNNNNNGGPVQIEEPYTNNHLPHPHHTKAPIHQRHHPYRHAHHLHHPPPQHHHMQQQQRTSTDTMTVGDQYVTATRSRYHSGELHQFGNSPTCIPQATQHHAGVGGETPTPLGVDGVKVGSSPNSSSTVQQYHKLFIKEGLKMKVKQNLKVEHNDELNDMLKQEPKVEPEELTAEDEERRRRRRERNKVAATKCRNKKKEKTCLLVTEGESLETQNHNLKQEITRLEAEKRRLVEILSLHEPSCAKRARLNCPMSSSNDGGNRSRKKSPNYEDDSHPEKDGGRFRVPEVPTTSESSQIGGGGGGDGGDIEVEQLPTATRSFARQDSFLHTLEILNSLDDMEDLVATDGQPQEEKDLDQMDGDLGDEVADPLSISPPPSSCNLSPTPPPSISSMCRETSSSSTSSSTYKSSCSFSTTKPNYFLVHKPQSLSCSSSGSFQPALGNRCIAL